MNIYQPQHLLITGGAGFIGSHFIRYLLQKNPTLSITNLDLLTYAGITDPQEHLPSIENYRFVKGDIRDMSLLQRLFKEHDIDTVVHFAAQSHVDRSIANPADFVSTNITGTFNLLEAARWYWFMDQPRQVGMRRFQHISTDEVFGSLDRQDVPFTEQSPYRPNSPYSASKAAADHLVRAYQETYGLPTVVTHCSNNYGQHQHPEKFIPMVIQNALAGKTIPIYGKGDQIRDWLFVTDHCEALARVLIHSKTGETYNIGGNNEQINLTVAKKICQQLDQLVPQKKSYETLIRFVSDRPGHDQRYAIDCSKIKRELGWQPNTSFEEGLAKTVQSYL